MPSVKHNSITAKATGLIFLLFDVASAREVPFGTPQYVQCILQGLTSVLLCVPFIFADSEKHWFGGCTWWLPLRNENRLYFSWWLPWLQRCFSNSSWFVLLCNELCIPDREGKWILRFQMISGACGTTCLATSRCFHVFNAVFHDGWPNIIASKVIFITKGVSRIVFEGSFFAGTRMGQFLLKHV